ncbi:chemotaxis protein CheW [Spirochaeta lutea]|uniref:Chemotaxis protein CheR n=1 Tax=Spirochaeta lutea TaxID=1480694 RepID=A0A098R261_9SPIO|nr:chemotaxis protein CheW [Spirochaeta lutea]KGE73753.1 hypothetical protein DC28_00535 [Spirochaeta lutea]
MATLAKKNRRASRTGLHRDAVEDKTDLVDFKMVTFSLAGKDYGIDIMKIKEIARFVNFTYVPNTPPFVRGVYNLRGEIISIIDLRAMFNLPHEKKKDGEEESGLILRLESNMIGVVVDRIDKVVGIHSSTIQPPHPIFGDINIKYISGVVENDGRLYIILDVERILGKQDDSQKENVKPTSLLDNTVTPAKTKEQTDSSAAPKESGSSKTKSGKDDTKQLNKQFVAESLEAIEGFHLTSLNQEWFDNRFDQWYQERGEADSQVQSQADAVSFLSTFFSPYTGKLWGDDYAAQFEKELPSELGKQIHVWNPGCGKGYESYCLAAVLRKKYPDVQIKIWASDKDLLNISGAPTLVFQENEVPSWCREFMTSGKNGLSFNQKIKDSILFEYHDINNTHSMPPIQVIMARDLFSFIKPEALARIFEEINDRVKGNGVLCLGKNEKPPKESGWFRQEGSQLGFARKG